MVRQDDIQFKYILLVHKILYSHAIIIDIRIFSKYTINKVMNLYNYNNEKSIKKY